MNTREIIVDILGKEWPLSSMQIYNIIKRNYRKNITYHTAYEIIQDLVNQGILARNERKYMLDKKWLNNEIERLIKMRKSYEENTPIKIVDKDTSFIKVGVNR